MDRKTTSQGRRFIEAAQEAGADADTNAADRLMGKLAEMPVEPRPLKNKTKRNIDDEQK